MPGRAPSEGLIMSTTAATITNVTYDGSSLSVFWTSATDASVTGYQIQVTSADYGVTYQSKVIPGGMADSGSFTLPDILNTNIVFTVQVVSQTGGGAGDSSPAVPLITALPDVTKVFYDGTDLHFEWAIAQSPAAGFELQVSSHDVGQSFTALIGDPLARSGRIPGSDLPKGGLDPKDSWTVQIAARGLNGVYATTPEGLSLPARLPSLVIEDAEYLAERRLDLMWKCSDISWIKIWIIELWSAQGAESRYIEIRDAMATSGSLPLLPPLPAGEAFLFRLEALDANGIGMASPAMPVVHPPSQVSTTVYDGASVTLGWSPSADQSVTSYGAQVVSLASGQSWQGSGTATGGSVATGALTPALDCVARVSAQCAGRADAVSVDAPILAAVPAITSARYDGDSLAVCWTPAAAPRVVAVTVQRLIDGAVVEQTTLHDPGAASHCFVLANPLAAGHTHGLRIVALAEGGASSLSAVLTVPVQLPALQFASWNGTQVAAGWDALAGATAFSLEVITPGGLYAQPAGGVATSATLTLPGLPGDGGANRLVLAATLAGGVTVATPPLPLPGRLPVVERAELGSKELTVSWLPLADASAMITGWRASVISTSSGTTYPAQSDDPLCRALVISGLPGGGLDPAQTWVLTVEALSEDGISAQTPPLAVVPKPPALDDGTYADCRMVATWPTLPDPSGSLAGFALEVAGTGLPDPITVSVPGPMASSGVLLLDRPLEEDGNYTLTLVALSKDGVRTPDQPVAINSALPAGLRLVYDGAQVSMRWQPALSPVASGQQLMVIGPASGMTYSTDIANISTSSGAVTAALGAGQPWLARVWATGGVAGGGLAVPVLLERPVITSVLYDGESVSLGWSPVVDPRVTGYLVSVTPDGGKPLLLAVDGVLSAGARLALDAALPTTGNSKVTVTALAGAAESLSDPVTLDTAQPQVSAILYSGGKVSATWASSANPAVTGYVLTVTAQSGRSFSQPVPGLASTSGTVAVGGSLGTEQGWRVSVQTQTAAGVSAGSTPAGLISEIPELTAVSYDGAKVDAAWIAPPDPVFGLASLQLVVCPAGSPTPDYQQAIADPLQRSGNVAAAGLGQGKVAEIRAVAASGAVTASAPVPVLVTSPAGLAVAYGAETVCASWTDCGALAYRVELTAASGLLLAAETVDGTTARLKGPLDPSVETDLRVALVEGVSIGPASAPVPVIAGLCLPSSTLTQGNSVTVAWTNPPVTAGVTAWKVRLYQNGTQIDLQTSTDGKPVKFTLAKPAIGACYEATVQMTGASTTGGETPPAPVLAVAPASMTAVLDGAVLDASWPAFTDPRTTGYTVTLYQGGTVVATLAADGTRLRAPVSLPADGTGRFTATVRALAGLAVGPESAAVPVPGQGYSYYQTPAQATVVPWLYRSQSPTPLPSPASAFTLYVPQIFTAAPTLPITSGAFSLVAATDGSAYPYMMAFAADNIVWTFTNEAIRGTLRADFDAFLLAVEAAGTTEFGLSLLRQVLALGLPLTYAETLYYRYGFDPVNRTCDLMAGMDVTLDGQVYQFEGTSSSAANLSGFVPGGGRDYGVGSYVYSNGARYNGFDAFLSMLTGVSLPPNTKGSGGVVDLYATGFRRAWWRLLYPASLNGGDSAGSYSFANNMAVLGCNSFADLQSATATYLKTGSFASSTVDYAATFFRGRMIATPQVKVSVDGQLRSVPVGTTVRQLTQGIGQLPAANQMSFGGIALARQTGCLVNCLQSDLGQQVGEVNPIALSAAAFTIQTGQADCLDLPVLGGDHLFVR
jgi:hypothetical protein